MQLDARFARAAIIVAVLAVPLAAQCTPTWSDRLGGVGVAGGAVNVLLSYYDGSGTAVYAGGAFTQAGGGPANILARWWGGKWSALGSGLGPAAQSNGVSIGALATYNPGTGTRLYAGGTFSTAGGAAAGNIASWNGAAWSALGTGIAGSPIPAAQPRVNAMIAHDDGSGPKLIVGGRFTTAGGIAANSIARWDGTSWSTMWLGFTEVTALAIFDSGSGPSLYAAGSITAGAVTIHGVARWTGTTWAAVGGPTTGPVLALAAFNDGSGPRLAAGGTFTSINGVPANNVAKWDGTQWSALGSGTGGTVRSLLGYDDGGGPALFAGGASITRWNGSVWSQVGGGLSGTTNAVNALATFPNPGGTVLAAGGDFSTASSVPGSAGIPVAGVASWNGSSWRGFGGGLAGGNGSAFCTFDDGTGPALYVGGVFTSAGGVDAHGVAKRTLSGWAPVGAGFDGPVGAFAVFDDGGGPTLYAGGSFTHSGGAYMSHVARLTNGAWVAVGSGMTGIGSNVAAFAVFNDGSGPALYAGGVFASPSSGIARWNGSAWLPVGGGLHGGPLGAWVNALAVHDFGSGPRLVAGGNFSISASFPSPSDAAAQWDGVAWSTVAAPPPGAGGSAVGTRFVEFDDGSGPALYMGTSTNSQLLNPGLYRLTPAGWVAFGLTPNPTSFSATFALHVFDGGTGPALWVGGLFSSAGGVASVNVARFGAPRALLSLIQPGGPGAGAYVVDSDLVPGHEYFNVFSPDICPGPPGSGPYLGLCSNDLNFLLSQVLLPIGAEPFHFIARDPLQSFGPFVVPAGSTFDGISSDFTGGTLHCVSRVSRITIQ